jgi:hypothetical protein
MAKFRQIFTLNFMILTYAMDFSWEKWLTFAIFQGGEKSKLSNFYDKFQ